MNTRRNALPIILITLVLSLLISSCQTPFSTEGVANAVTVKSNAGFEESCVALNQAIEARIRANPDGFAQSAQGVNNEYENFDVDGNIIADQAVVSGEPSAIDNVLSDLGLAPQQLFEIPLYDAASPMSATGVVRLYQLDNQISVYDFAHQFNAVATQQTGTIDDTTPLAEPNLVVHGPESPFIENTGGSGGKSTILGSGGKSTILGSGGDSLLPMAMNGNQAADAFNNQWAFEQINLIDNGQRNVSQSGREVNIVVFDTSPYERVGIQRPEAAANPFEICNMSLIDSYGRTMEPNEFSDKLQNHGLFVSGLAQAVAPESRIHLVQVLNDDMTGNVFTLLNGVDLYAQAQQEVTGPQKTIFNMSLVISPARDFLFAEGDEQTSTALEFYFDQLGVQGCDQTSIAMCRSMGRYEAMGYVMVAAAGNLNLSETQYPASDGRVLGVSGTTENGNKSCFANAGEVAAPAGNGLEDLNAQTCDLRLAPVCPDGEPCDRDGIRTIISLAEPSTGYESGYAQWVGTSFAAPQVAGLAALSFEVQPAARDFTTLQSGAQNVTAAVTGNAEHIVQPPIDGLGAGVINTSTTLPQP